jgi:hypothetical protein
MYRNYVKKNEGPRPQKPSERRLFNTEELLVEGAEPYYRQGIQEAIRSFPTIENPAKPLIITLV